MNCRECLDLMGGYLDGELAPGLKQQLELHLLACGGCQRLLSGCQQTIQAYRRQPVPELPAALHRRIMERVRDQPKLAGADHP